MSNKFLITLALCALATCCSAHWWGGNSGYNGWGNNNYRQGYWGGNNGWGNNNYYGGGGSYYRPSYNWGGGGSYYRPSYYGGGGGGWRHHNWWDVSDSAKVIDAKTACTAFIEEFADEALPADKIDAFVTKKFFKLQKIDSAPAPAPAAAAVSRHARVLAAEKRTEEEKRQTSSSEEMAPFVFQCCHIIYGKDLLKNPTAAQTSYLTPPLPQGATCPILVDELFKQLSGKTA